MAPNSADMSRDLAACSLSPPAPDRGPAQAKLAPMERPARRAAIQGTPRTKARKPFARKHADVRGAACEGGGTTPAGIDARSTPFGSWATSFRMGPERLRDLLQRVSTGTLDV